MTPPGATDPSTVSFGLVGTGYWARAVHGRSLTASPGVELVGVWGRDRDRTRAAADELGTRPYDAVGDLVSAVDAVDFAVPPDVQVDLATQAAGAGRHLFLEKPVSTTVQGAERLAAAVRGSDVASIVFLTSRFVPPLRQWLDDCGRGEWFGGWGRMFGAAIRPGSPFDTPWRREKGALWDLGPHGLAIVEPVLGPVTSVLAAARGRADLVHLALDHGGGTTSTLSLTIEAPTEAAHDAFGFWGPSGSVSMPSIEPEPDPVDAHRRALGELVAAIRSGSRTTPCDVHDGARMVRVLAEAERLLAG